MKVLEHRKFRNQLLKSDIYIKKKVRECLAVFFDDPHHSILNNHALLGKRKGQRSLNVSGDRRIIFKELSNGKYELVELLEL